MARDVLQGDEANQGDAEAQAGEFPQLHKIVGGKIVMGRGIHAEPEIAASAEEGGGRCWK